ncbi:DUF262 domain-containing protein [Kaistella flava (ex Peng et al. 2021)]|uniref:DUF262 domain-containing protein n=1 Tax=Kaistella flava (ex Peng et al. 2021) TaxID=2038776 RepID=A0A7M2Y8X1_9FLAO|nr:DUF262 domain-containing protein [Kaistella flava (ex Peng et al. 2021)]QOW09783.1 DUF262 domain-containing protein [Kaistella flava (ex Peng et al. 2021)]
MKITPTPLTISQLFSTRNEQFFIPAYQRRYAWKWKQCKDLFNDIKNLTDDDSHLLGNLVCLTGAHTAKINQLEVIDGQQRITTLSLLLTALSKAFEEKKDTEEASKIEGYLKASGVDRVKENKVTLGELDNPDYIKVLKDADPETIHNENLKNNFAYFTEWISELTDDEFNSFYYKLMDKVSVIRLDVFQAKDAYKLFETINNRGLSLSPTDIIKNFLLGHASSLDQETLTAVKENWRDIIISLDGIDTDEFFRHFMCSQLRKKITYTFLNDEFKKLYVNSVEACEGLAEYRVYSTMKIEKEEDDIEDELESDEEIENSSKEEVEDEKSEEQKITAVSFTEMLANYAKTYSYIRNRKFSNNKINNAILDLQRIKSIPTYTFLLELFSRDNITDSDRIVILKMVAVFMLRRHICLRQTAILDDIFSDLVNMLDKHNIIDAVGKRLSKDIPDDEEFKLNFVKADYKRSINRAKYVLEQFEYKLHETEGEFTINSGVEVHLEHIIPQTITTKKSKKEFGDWELYLGEGAKHKHSDVVNRIGNLTLLGQKLNIVASNNPFEDKVEQYNKSSLKITKEIAENYEEFKFDQVASRSKDLADKAIKIWKI